MEYDMIKIGKIRKIDYDKGIGEIVTSDSNYFFTIDDISYNGTLFKGDNVKFRAENVQGVNKAYFVNKINHDFKLESIPIIKGKKLKRGE